MKIEKEDLLKDLKNFNEQIEQGIANINKNQLSLTRLEYDAPTDDEIIKLASESLESKYKQKKDSLTDLTTEKKNDFLSAIERAKENSQREKIEVNDNFEKAKQSVENNALKRGMARSSVVVNEVGQLERQKNSQLGEVDRELTEKIEGINSQINSLEAELSQSIKDLDMEKAVELNEKITTLKEERKAKQDEVIKYNNSISETETKYNNSYANGVGGEAVKELTNRINKEKVQTALNYYTQLPTEELALESLQGDIDVISAMGEYYPYLIKAIMAHYAK